MAVLSMLCQHTLVLDKEIIILAMCNQYMDVPSEEKALMVSAPHKPK